MGEFFGSRLRDHRTARRLSAYRVAKGTGVMQQTLSSVELGKRPPSDRLLEALAEFDELELSLAELKAWAHIDMMGTEGLENLRRYAPELMGALTVAELVQNTALFDAEQYKHTKHPPNEVEVELINRALKAGVSFSPITMAGFWDSDPIDRERTWAILRALVVDAENYDFKNRSITRGRRSNAAEAV